jgi:AcrR family transcriptional regulator
MAQRQGPAKDVKRRIFDEAIRLFGENGFEGTSIQSIADAVGIRKPSLLYHFSSKVALREAVIRELITRWTAELPQVLTRARGGHDRFSSIITSLVGFFLADPNRARLAVREMMDRPEETSAMVAEQLVPWTSMIVDYIRMGQESGMIIRNTDPESYLVQIMMMVIGTVAFGNTAAAILGAGDEAGSRRIDELVRIARVSLFTEEGK